MVWILLVMYLITKARLIGNNLILMLVILFIGIALGLHIEEESRNKQ